MILYFPMHDLIFSHAWSVIYYIISWCSGGLVYDCTEWFKRNSWPQLVWNRDLVVVVTNYHISKLLPHCFHTTKFQFYLYGSDLTFSRLILAAYFHMRPIGNRNTSSKVNGVHWLDVMNSFMISSSTSNLYNFSRQTCLYQSDVFNQFCIIASFCSLHIRSPTKFCTILVTYPCSNKHAN